MRVTGDDGERIARLETRVDAMAAEIVILRTRSHKLAGDIAPLVLNNDLTMRHDDEIDKLRTAIDRARGGWKTLSIAGALGAAVASMVTTAVAFWRH